MIAMDKASIQRGPLELPISAASASRVRSATLVRRALRKLRNLALLAALLVVWQAISVWMLDRTTRTLLPPPTTVLQAAWELVSNMRTGVKLEKENRLSQIPALRSLPIAGQTGFVSEVGLNSHSHRASAR